VTTVVCPLRGSGTETARYRTPLVTSMTEFRLQGQTVAVSERLNTANGGAQRRGWLV